jgi:hypothetical protein
MKFYLRDSAVEAQQVEGDGVPGCVYSGSGGKLFVLLEDADYHVNSVEVKVGDWLILSPWYVVAVLSNAEFLAKYQVVP